MADIIHAEGTYKIAGLGPVDSYSFDGKDGGKVEMKKYSIQLEGIADWINYSLVASSDAPKVGDSLEGHVEDGGKYGFKFVKKRKGGSWGGGSGGGPGAAWNGAYTTAATVVAGYYAAAGKAPASIDEYMQRLDQIAVKVKAAIDKAAGTAEAPKPKAAPQQETLPTVDTEGQPVATTPGVENVKSEDLGSW